MVFFLLVPLLLGGVAVAMAKSASEALSEDSVETWIPVAYSNDEDFDYNYEKSRPFSFQEIKEMLMDFDKKDVFKTYNDNYDDNVAYDELLEVLEEHKKRIQHLERMLEKYH